MHRGKPSPSDSKEARKAYYQKNKEKILAARVNHKPRIQSSKYDRYLDWRFKRLYNISLDDYKEMERKQNGLCAICNCPETITDKRLNTQRRLAVDHCHTTGKIRGLLCYSCNVALGKFKDDVSMLESAIKYLKESS